MDTGCGFDLVAKNELKQLTKVFRKSDVGVKLNTANGQIKSCWECPMHLNALGEIIAPRVLPSTPNVLAVGRRCAQMGWTFVWNGASTPCFISPTKREFVLLTIKKDVPYPEFDAQLEKLTRSDRLKEAGLILKGNRLYLDLENSPLYGMLACSTDAAPASSGKGANIPSAGNHTVNDDNSESDMLLSLIHI